MVESKRFQGEDLTQFQIKHEEVAAYVEELEQSLREWHPGFTESGLASVYSDDDEGRGINLSGLFKKKPKETKPASVAPDLSFLIAERREVAMRGRLTAQPEELVITAVPSPAQDPKQPEFLYLIQQFTWAD